MGFVSIDVWTLIFTWGNLLILYLIMKKIFFKPVRKMMLDRETEIKELYDGVEKTQSEADAMKLEYETKLENAKNEANEIVKSASHRAALKSEEIINDAHKEAASIIERADKQIEADKKTAENELKDELSGMAVSIAGKVLEEEIDPDKHKVLIDRFIDEMGEAK